MVGYKSGGVEHTLAECFRERGELADGNRFVIPRAVIEQEFRATGFTILNRQDFIPGYAMWRVYALRKCS